VFYYQAPCSHFSQKIWRGGHFTVSAPVNPSYAKDKQKKHKQSLREALQLVRWGEIAAMPSSFHHSVFHIHNAQIWPYHIVQYSFNNVADICNLQQYCSTEHYQSGRTEVYDSYIVKET